MKNQPFDKEALSEIQFPADSVLQELIPLLADYFVGEQHYDNGTIIMNFPNGQQFSITIQETA